MSRFWKYVLKVVPEMLMSMNPQRAAAKIVGSRVRQTCGQTGQRGQLANMESRVKLRACLSLACLVSKRGYCLPLSIAGATKWDKHARCFPSWKAINKYHYFSMSLMFRWLCLVTFSRKCCRQTKDTCAHLHQENDNSSPLMFFPHYRQAQRSYLAQCMPFYRWVNTIKGKAETGPWSHYLRVPTVPLSPPFCCLFAAAASDSPEHTGYAPPTCYIHTNV